MDQIIIEHYNNSCNFLSLINFKIPFIVDNGLYFNEEQVFKDKIEFLFFILEEGILINKKKEGFWISWDKNDIKKSEGNFKDGKKEGIWIYYYENMIKESEGNYKDGKEEGFWIEWNKNLDKRSEGNYKDGEKEEFFIRWNKDGKLNGMHRMLKC